MTVLSGWGRYPRVDCRTFVTPRHPDEVAAPVGAPGSAIAQGNARSYGDSALSRETVVSSRHLTCLIDFDAETGLLTCEAGVVLADILRVFVPRGFFPPVSPGTKFVTVGGMIAADVHGKNHHRDGSFGRHVAWLDLLTADGTVVRCSHDQNRDLFDWTIGGMGLTGIILRAAFRLRRIETAYIRQKTLAAANLGEAMDILDREDGWTYSVAWIDCLTRGDAAGRSLVYLGEHAGVGDLTPRQAARPLEPGRRRKLSVPIDLPSWTLNRWSVKAFNELYYRRGRQKTDQVIDYDTYFYPLDNVLGWNRIYGRRGFAQYQFVLPLERSRDGMKEALECISRSGCGSFLSVLKRFGPQDSAFSFPMEGYTLALDFPLTQRAERLFEELDTIVIRHGGRLYLAKDARLPAASLQTMDARAEAFRRWREESGARDAFRSHQSERLGL